MFDHLVYVSTATERPSRADLLDVLEVSRRNNARDGVTGMLLHSAGTYMQVLEGLPDVLDATYARIAADPRHRVGQVILREPQASRTFQAWTMGFRTLDDLTDEERAGVTPLLEAGVASGASARGARTRAERLLEVFRAMARRDL